MWIDAHAHLSSVSSSELKNLLEEAELNNVKYILNTSTNLTDATKVVEQCKENNSLYGTVGISPFDCVTLTTEWREDLKRIAENSKIIAIGEIGLDSTNPSYPSLNLQKKVFEEQLEIGITSGLPMVIHSRGAEKVVLEICKNNGVGDAMFHCFTGSKADAKTIVDAGYYISISGIVTFRNSNLTEVVKSIPLDRLLIETDSPYLSPEPYRGKINHPAWVKFVGEKIAEILAISEELLQENIKRNFMNLFKKFKPFLLTS
ncbi:MAG: TatD family hydrolase [Chitinispirillaceae bacterium]|nr:TatD family hydrolase [Chitinispirillaceae bacterium]